MADLIGIRLAARMAGGKPADPNAVTQWEIVEELGEGRVALESKPRGDRPATRIERTVAQLRDPAWKRLR